MAIAAGYLACATSVFAQAGYLSRDPNVAVDMSVLEELGSPATVAGPRLQSPISTPSGLAFPPPAPPVSRLTGTLANRPLLTPPPPRKQAAAPASPSAVPPAPVIVESTPPIAPAPPAKVEVQVAAPPPPPPPPPPAPPAEPKEAAAPPPPPEPAPAPEPTPAPEPVQAKAPAPADERPAAAEPPATPTLTPSPAGAASQPAAPAQTASTTPVDGLPPAFRVLFDEKSATISDAAHGQLDELTAAMKQNESVRVQLLAYAGGAAGTASQARRLSLSRALAVRSYLINQGVRSTRMDVRALGNQTEGGPADRVDAVIIER